MFRRLRDRGVARGRARTFRTTAPRVEAVEPRVMLSGDLATIVAGEAAVLGGEIAPLQATGADLVLTLDTVPSGLLEVGQTVFYSVTVVNNGPEAAADVTLVNTLPTNATFVATTAGTYDAGAGTVTVEVVELAAGASLQVWIAVEADQAGNLINQAYVLTTTPDPDKETNVAYTFDQVVAPVVPPPPPTNLAAPAPQVVSVERVGYYGAPMAYVIRFDQPMSASAVQTSGNYLLEAPGPAGRLDGVLNPPIPIKSLSYDPATNSVVLIPNRRISLHDRVKLTINGDMVGVSSAQGIVLDGNADGRVGGNFVAILEGFTARPPRPLPPWVFNRTR